MADRTVSVRLRAEVTGYIASIRSAGQATSVFSRELLDKAGRHEQAFRTMGGAATIVGGMLVAGFGAAVKAAADFDKQMSAVAAVSDASAGELDRLRQAALKAGADTAFSASEAARAEEELAKVGIATADILGGALSGSLALAAAGGLELAESAEIAGQAMNIFELKGKDVGHIADVLAAGANKSAADVRQLALAMRQGGQVAAQTGLSLEDTVGVLAAFADRALIGSDAGTSLKTMLQKLSAPSQEAADLMAQLGINAYDAAGNFVGIHAIAGQLQRGLGGLSQAERDMALATIFGSDAVRAANVLFTLGEQGVRKYTTAVNDQGAAADVAAKRMDNLAGDLEQLKGSIETALIQSGSGANSVLREMVQGVTAAVNAFNSLPGPVQTGVTAVLGIGGALTLAAGGFLYLVPKIAETKVAMETLGISTDKVKGKLSGIGQTAGVVSGVLAVTVAIGMLENQLNGIDANLPKLQKDLVAFGQSGKLSGEMTELWGDSLAEVVVDVETWGEAIGRAGDNSESFRAAVSRLADPGPLESFKSGIIGVTNVLTLGTVEFDESKTKIQAMDAALAQMVASGRHDAAAQAFARMTQEAKAMGVSTEKLKEIFPQYTTALDATTAVSQQTGSAMQVMGDKANNAAGQVDQLKKELELLNQAALSAAQTEIRFQAAVDAVTGSVREHGRVLNINTAAGRANKQAILEAIEAAGAHAQKVYEETGSIQLANQAMAQHVAQLASVMRQAGYTDAQIKNLIGTYLRVPADAKTSVSAPGAVQSKGQVDSLTGSVHRVPSTRDVKFSAETRQATSAINTLFALVMSLQAQVIALQIQVAIGNADGGILRAASRIDHFATGAERHVAQIAPAGAWRLWAEPETGGEAYIPLARAKRQRSAAILSQVADEFGYWLLPHRVRGPQRAPRPASRREQADGTAAAMFHIENYHAASGHSARRTAEELWMLTRARG